VPVGQYRAGGAARDSAPMSERHAFGVLGALVLLALLSCRVGGAGLLLLGVLVWAGLEAWRPWRTVPAAFRRPARANRVPSGRSRGGRVRSH